MKKTLKGSSLVETLTASVIFLTVFLIAMDSMTTIAGINHSGASPVDMEKAVGECLEKFAVGSGNTASYSYMWGHVEIEAEPYKRADDLLDVTVTAKAGNRCTITYRYLICPHSIRN